MKVNHLHFEFFFSLLIGGDKMPGKNNFISLLKAIKVKTEGTIRKNTKNKYQECAFTRAQYFFISFPVILFPFSTREYLVQVNECA